MITIQSQFIDVYTDLVIGETFLLLFAAVVIARLARDRNFLRRKVQLSRPAIALLSLTLVAGLSLFVFWVGVDVLSGYNAFPDYALRTYPLIAAAYNDLGLGGLPLPDKNRLIGLVAFSVAELSFIILRAGKGIGIAVRDGILFFAAPLIIAFELALFYFVPVEMYWRVTALTSWSIGKYATSTQFSAVTGSPFQFPWAGNVYLLSNWFVLLAGASLFAFGVLKFLAPLRFDEE